MAKEKTKTESIPGEAGAVGTGLPVKPGKPVKPVKPGKPGKRGKREKRPRRPKRRGKDAGAAIQPLGGAVPDKKRKNVRKKKSGGKSQKLVILIIIVLAALLILAGATYLVVFNQFGVRDKMFDIIYTLDPRERAKERVLEQESEKLDIRAAGVKADEEEQEQREGELDLREGRLDEEEKRLETLREQLAKQEVDLAQREQERLPRYLQPMTDEQLADLKRLAKIYSTMTAAEAVSIMSALYDVQDMVAIIYQMNDRTVAAILAAMDVALAVEITDILLHE